MATRKLSDRLEAEIDQHGLRLHFTTPTRKGMTEALTIAEAYHLALFLHEHIDILANQHQSEELRHRQREQK